jgi:hypothetical protein
MHPDLDRTLCAKYPELFRDRDAPMTHTAMCWGFECGNGWYALIDTLCEHLLHPVYTAFKDWQRAADIVDARTRGDAQHALFDTFTETTVLERKQIYDDLLQSVPVAVQVKEKFGRLCFYVHTCTEEQSTIIQFAEAMSLRICNDCGTTAAAHLRSSGNWVRTLCPSCAQASGYACEEKEEPV